MRVRTAWLYPLGFPACERRYQHSRPQGARISAFGDGPWLANAFGYLEAIYGELVIVSSNRELKGEGR
jgi:hypothetical protein